ncbi:non-structural maintenance of chromosomes element 3 homolog [Telopea speciosissima]|uniref:non-structural maintenance of chromosomes element 3 homolog n=1 Tax=Telopea speciosissima TaxID=54955 RepID=UPI001CC4836E|nr:non-structural maintenance of chromosomes element 3 homolog [Telopea speciosissima]
MANSLEDFSQFDISKEEKDKLVAEVIRYVLYKTYQSSGCPIKREELTQLITKNYRQRGLPSLVINEAREKLSSIFGYEMKELQRVRSSTNQGQSSQHSLVDAKSYVIISKIPPEVYRKHVENTKTFSSSGFTFAVIGIVHLAGGKISEEDLWDQLKRMGLHDSDEGHPVFGNIKQQLESLVQQRYLQKDKVNNVDGSSIVFELAERALDDSVIGRVKEYIGQIMKKDDASEEID